MIPAQDHFTLPLRTSDVPTVPGADGQPIPVPEFGQVYRNWPDNHPAWWRYRNEPDVLHRIIAGHYVQLYHGAEDPDFYEAEIAAIKAHLEAL